MAEIPSEIPYSFEQYLQLEAADPQTKYELIEGKVYAMAGGTIQHGMIVSNLLFRIREGMHRQQLPCKAFGGDVKVFIDAAKAYVYPDLFVVCGEVDDSTHPGQAINNPKLIIEVLSPSTQPYDRTQKFRLYRTLPSFQEYVMVDQNQSLIESYFRLESNHWQIHTFMGLQSSLELASLGLSLRLQEVYEGVLEQ